MIPLKDNIPTSRFPLVTVTLIAICIAVFVWQLSFSNDVSKQPNGGLRALDLSQRDENTIEYGGIPYRILHPGHECAAGVTSSTGSGNAEVVCRGTPEYSEAETLARERPRTAPLVGLALAPALLTLFSSMFMHGGLLHIGFNLLFLWIFGNSVEEWMGRLKFALFYLAAGVVALYAQTFVDPGSTVPTIGASGAIAGVLGAYAVLHPRARVLTLIFIIFFVTLVEIPVLVMLGIWFALQFALQFIPAVGEVATPGVEGSDVAYFAHVGGLIFGLLLAAFVTKVLRRPRPATP